MSAGKRRSGRRAEAACNYDVDAGGGVDIDATTSEDRSTLPVRGFGSQITGSIIHEGEPDEDDLSSSVSPGVRLHYVMKEPARLTKGSAKNLEDVKAWRDKWSRYLHEAKWSDVASATMEMTVLRRWNLILSKDARRLTESELANMPALEVADMLVTHLEPLKK